VARKKDAQTQRRLQPEFHAALLRIQPLRDAAEAGDDVALAQLRAFFDDNPSIWQQYSDFMGSAEDACIQAMTEDSRLDRELWRKRVDDVRNALLEPDSTPLERLLIEQIAMCWLQVQQAEIECFLQLNSRSFKQGAYNEQRLDRIQTRYLAAVKALAQVRRLQRPHRVQMNIAENQINVAALATPSQEAIEAPRDDISAWHEQVRRSTVEQRIP
jgi:hypothetical protein